MKFVTLVIALLVLAGSTFAKEKDPKGPARAVIIVDANGLQIGVPVGPFIGSDSDWIYLDGANEMALGYVDFDGSFAAQPGHVIGLVDVYFTGPGCVGPAFVETVDLEGIDLQTDEIGRGVPTLGGDRVSGFYVGDFSVAPALGEAHSILRKFGRGCESGTFPMISRPAIPVQVTYAPPLRIAAGG
jgi:hypothetical protein